jgi:hypothetical protein
MPNFLPLLGAGKPPAAAPSGPTLFIGGASVLANGYSAGNKTFQANGGTDLPACLFVCAFASDDGFDPSTFQIGATNLAKVSNDSSGKVQLWAALYAGGSDTITIGNGNAFGLMARAAGWVTGGSLIATAVSPQSRTYGSVEAKASVHMTLSSACVIPSGGVGFIVGACLNSAKSAESKNWANVDVSPTPSDGYTVSTARISLACEDTAGSWSPEFWGTPDVAGYDYAAGLAACAFGT